MQTQTSMVPHPSGADLAPGTEGAVEDQTPSSWWDADLHRWFETAGGTDIATTLEIELQDRGTVPWWRSLFMQVDGGTQFYRFVARTRPGTLDGAQVVETSGTFPVSPLELPPRNFRAEGAWADEVTTELERLDERLREQGWQPSGRGPDWWSRIYTRPAPREAHTGSPRT
jgi:hypothetical protein